ncbi:MAG: DUF86 domain-containing protein [Acidimicrobiia bacterium]
MRRASFMQQRDRDRIAHMLDAAQKAVAYAQQRTRSELEMDELLRLGLTKLVEIVGEAAKQVSESTQREYPEVPWSNAARMRDRLVHHYFAIDVDILWRTVTEEMPALVHTLDGIDIRT